VRANWTLSRVEDVPRSPLIALLVAASLVMAACSADVAVTATRSESNQSAPTPSTSAPTDDPPTSAPGTSIPNTPVPDDPDPTNTPGTNDDDDPVANTPSTPPAVIDSDAIDFGSNKPDRDYDDFLLATLSDLNTWWLVTYPQLYGDEWIPLQGAVYAAYPDRPDDLPGCGEPRTSYQDVQEFVAFYCGLGDFIVYDDGETGLLAELADNFGAGTIAIVLAHEYGHAIQQRSGVLDRSLPTVTSEQQADCFAGAWAGRASRGEGGITFSDANVRAGLIAMLEVRDPVGIDPFTPGGHGSGFDRVGAFQTGFVQGPARCGDLIDDPLPLMPNQFNDRNDEVNNGNAPFGYDQGEPGVRNAELFGFLVPDLNLFWGIDAAVPGWSDLNLVPVQRIGDATCDEPLSGFEAGAALCASTDTVYLNEPEALDLYNQEAFGDFSLGYLIGIAWAEAAQRTLGSTLQGEARELVNDCLAGAWVQTVIPVGDRLPEPRAEGRSAVVSPGDLDEAILTAIVIGDLGIDDNIIGSSFEKIDAFRSGVIGGLDACAA
jgi:predicted metalloprotease